MTKQEREQEMDEIYARHDVDYCRERRKKGCEDCRKYFYLMTDGHNDEDADEADQKAWGV